MTAGRPRIAIIGGGLAGMSAALALRERPGEFEITLYESKRFTGGRAGSFVDPQSGERVDYCQHVAMGCCTNLLAMMKSVGLEDSFTRHRELTFLYPGHRPARFSKSRWLPAPFHLLPSLIRFPYLSWKQSYEISRAMFALMRTPSNVLRPVTAQAWLLAQKQSPHSIRAYWEVVIASALGESYQQVSMAAVRKVFVDGFLSSRDACDVLVPKSPLGHLFGSVLPDVVAQKGVDLRLGTKVRSLTAGNDGSMLLELDKERVVYDHVIVAVPSASISKLLTPDTAHAAGVPRRGFASVPTSPITGIHLWFDQPILDRRHAVLVGTLAQWVFGQSTERGSDEGSHYIQVVISASHGLRAVGSEELIMQVVRELQQAFPEAAAAKLIRSRVVTDPNAVFSLRPEVNALRPASRTALPCLHLAGDFVQTGWPATMEGAVISGRMAASGVLANIGQPAISICPGLPPSRCARWLIRA